MQEYIESLQRLQIVDLRIRELTEGLKRHPDEISSLKEELKQREQSIEFLQSHLNELEKQKKALESSVELNRQSIKRSEERLFSIKTHREYEALQTEITDTRKQNLELENQTLSVMEETEQKEALLAEQKQSYSSIKGEYEERIIEKEKKIEEIEISLEPAQKEKNELVSQIDPRVLPVYEKIFKRNGKALARAEDEKCTSCNINIPPQLFNEILKRSKLIQCPSCKKILYAKQ